MRFRGWGTLQKATSNHGNRDRKFTLLGTCHSIMVIGSYGDEHENGSFGMFAKQYGRYWPTFQRCLLRLSSGWSSWGAFLPEFWTFRFVLKQPLVRRIVCLEFVGQESWWCEWVWFPEQLASSACDKDENHMFPTGIVSLSTELTRQYILTKQKLFWERVKISAMFIYTISTSHNHNYHRGIAEPERIK
jgi:hypothetical protein